MKEMNSSLLNHRRQVFQDHTGDLPINHTNVLQRQIKPTEFNVLIYLADGIVFFEQFITALAVENQ